MLTDFYTDLVGGANRRTYRRPRKAKKRKTTRRNQIAAKRKSTKYSRQLQPTTFLKQHLKYFPPIPVSRSRPSNNFHLGPGIVTNYNFQHTFPHPNVIPAPVQAIPVKYTVEEPLIFQDAKDYFENRRPPDGEADTDYEAKKKWSLDDVIAYLQKIPQQIRKVILTSLFGATLGLIVDLLLGGPWGLTTRLLRLIVSLVPGGKILLFALDGLGYFLGKTEDPNLVAYDPELIRFGTDIQKNINGRLTEDVVRAAEEQLGSGFMRTLGALFAAAASAGTHLKFALPAIPLAVIRPFQR
ncbi:p32K [Bovine adenovirus 6]|uniref:p32K n=1 Tax=Bovine adenovirus 6 TaxID=111167 RepID=K9MMD1_9ADEN|nr:p32K [Bovine adenovirus 6]AFV70629.1 p32K [Bovine adenovirus 6]